MNKFLAAILLIVIAAQSIFLSTAKAERLPIVLVQGTLDNAASVLPMPKKLTYLNLAASTFFQDTVYPKISLPLNEKLLKMFVCVL